MHNKLVKIENEIAIIDVSYHREYDIATLERAIRDAVKWLKLLMEIKRKMNDEYAKQT